MTFEMAVWAQSELHIAGLWSCAEPKKTMYKHLGSDQSARQVKLVLSVEAG
jgi:hypothetical protein